jgi:hypothetical protein
MFASGGRRKRSVHQSAPPKIEGHADLSQDQSAIARIAVNLSAEPWLGKPRCLACELSTDRFEAIMAHFRELP